MLTSFPLLSSHSLILPTTSLPHKLMTASYFLFLHNSTYIGTHSHIIAHITKTILGLFCLYVLMLMVNQEGHSPHPNFSNPY